MTEYFIDYINACYSEQYTNMPNQDFEVATRAFALAEWVGEDPEPRMAELHGTTRDYIAHLKRKVQPSVEPSSSSAQAVGGQSSQSVDVRYLSPMSFFLSFTYIYIHICILIVLFF